MYCSVLVKYFLYCAVAKETNSSFHMADQYGKNPFHQIAGYTIVKNKNKTGISFLQMNLRTGNNFMLSHTQQGPE